jgi:hypothetical protein
VRVVGGPYGQPDKVPNSKVKRGYSIRQPKWRFDLYPGDSLPTTVPAPEGWYELRIIADKPIYLYVENAALRKRIIQANPALFRPNRDPHNLLAVLAAHKERRTVVPLVVHVDVEHVHEDAELIGTQHAPDKCARDKCF